MRSYIGIIRKYIFLTLILMVAPQSQGEEIMELDKYYEFMYSGGTVTLSIDGEFTFSSNELESVKSKTYKIKLISIDGNVAVLDIDGDTQRLERGRDYSYDLIRFIGIGYSETKLVLAIGSGV